MDDLNVIIKKYKDKFLNIYTGNELEIISNKVISNNKYNRKKLKEICRLINLAHENNKMIGIIGDRRVGKTNTLYCIANKLNYFNNTILITLNDGTDFNILDKLLNELKLISNDIIIMIDEITSMKDLSYLKNLYENYYMFFYAIIISGTYSMALLKLSGNLLFGRIYLVNLERLSTVDYLNMGESIEDYINNAGIFQNIDCDTKLEILENDKLINFYNSFIKLLECNKEEINIKYNIRDKIKLSFYLVNIFGRDLNSKNKFIKYNNKLYVDDELSNINLNYNEFLIIINKFFNYGIISKINIIGNEKNKLNNYKIISDIPILSYLLKLKYNMDKNIKYKSQLFDIAIEDLLHYVVRNKYRYSFIYREDYLESIKGEIDLIFLDEYTNLNLVEIKNKNKIEEKHKRHLLNDKIKEYLIRYFYNTFDININKVNKYIVYRGETYKDNDIEVININDFCIKYDKDPLLEINIKYSTSNKNNLNLNWE